MMRKIFRPGAGQVPQRFIAAYNNGTLAYRGDTMIWDTTAPASQGSSGVLAGQTLGASDFIFVTYNPATSTAYGLQAGIAEGLFVGDKNVSTALPNDGIIIVQTYGIHQHTNTDATSAAGDKLVISGNATFTGMAHVIAATATINASDLGTQLVGISMTAAAATGTRGTVTTNAQCVAFVRCDF